MEPRSGYPYLRMTAEKPRDNSPKDTQSSGSEDSEQEELKMWEERVPNLMSPTTYDEMLASLAFMGIVWLLIGLMAHWWNNLQ